MADLERVHVKLGLSGTYWDKRPSFRIIFNDQQLAEATISSATNTVEYHEFDIEYTSDTARLVIELLNKEPSDTKKDNYDDPDNYTIIDDMLLNIESIEIDNIDLGQIPYALGEYRPVNSQEVLKNFINLGWNGTWTLTWDNPFYLWLLENL